MSEVNTDAGDSMDVGDSGDARDSMDVGDSGEAADSVRAMPTQGLMSTPFRQTAKRSTPDSKRRLFFCQ